MTVWYSDHFGADGIADSTPASPEKLMDAAIVHTRLRVKRMEVSFVGASPVPAVADVVRLGQFKPTDRIYGIQMIVEALVVALATADIGIHEAGVRHNGPAADADLFATLVPLSAVGVVDIFGMGQTGITTGSESGTLEAADRGRPLYALLDEGRGDTVYSTTKRDIPLELTMTLQGTQGTAAGVVILEVWYVSGD